MVYGEDSVFAYIRIQRHYVYILNSLSVSGLAMEPHGFGSDTVKSVSSVQRIVLYDAMCLQIGVVCQVLLVEVTFL